MPITLKEIVGEEIWKKLLALKKRLEAKEKKQKKEGINGQV